ncbi:hypothetical protein OH492_02645 [Vibrio chagasii]|nr:hypothetical protein [Vibrio chagasii]
MILPASSLLLPEKVLKITTSVIVACKIVMMAGDGRNWQIIAKVNVVGIYGYGPKIKNQVFLGTN